MLRRSLLWPDTYWAQPWRAHIRTVLCVFLLPFTGPEGHGVLGPGGPRGEEDKEAHPVARRELSSQAVRHTSRD